VEAQFPDGEVVAHLSVARAAFALVLILAIYSVAAAICLGVATGAWSLTPRTAGLLLVMIVALVLLARQTWYLMKAAMGSRVAIYRIASNVVCLDPAFYSVSISQFDFKSGDLAQLQMYTATGAVKYVPFFWLQEPQDVVIERLSALRPSAGTP
jgi:hypothetical protein